MDRRLDSLRSGDMCGEALHLRAAFRNRSCIGLPQVASARTPLSPGPDVAPRPVSADRLRNRGLCRFAARRCIRSRGRCWFAGAGAGGTEAPTGVSRRETLLGKRNVPLDLQLPRFSKQRGHANLQLLHFLKRTPAQRASRVGRARKRPRERGPEETMFETHYCWMRVRQYGHTFQSALSGRWQVGQTLRTCVLQIGQTTKSRSIGAPHLGQMP